MKRFLVVSFIIILFSCFLMACSSNTSSTSPENEVSSAPSEESTPRPTSTPMFEPTPDATTKGIYEEALSAYKQGDYDTVLAELDKIENPQAEVIRLKEIVEALMEIPVYAEAESFSGDVQVYGNNNLQISPDTFLIPFLNLRSGELRLQVGVAVANDDYNSPYKDLATFQTIEWKPENGEMVGWDTAGYSIYDYDDTVSRVVFETILESEQAHTLLKNLGDSSPETAIVRLTDYAQHKDYTIRERELEACKMISAYDTLWQEGKTILVSLIND